MKNFEYIENYYLKQNDIIKLVKNGVSYCVISYTDNGIMLLNVLKNKSRLIFRKDYPKIYRQINQTN